METTKATRKYALQMTEKDNSSSKCYPRGALKCLDYRGLKIIWASLVLLCIVGVILFLSLRSEDLAVTSEGLTSLLKEKDVRLSLGMRNDYLLQDCGRDTHLKQSFPNVDYALFGYDILKGFPLAEGHDPGFTLPIFTTDYPSGSQSADCRFSVPKGLVIVPDVSCVTSFTSQIIKTQRAYARSLSVSVGVEASGYGASFSSSVGYKEASSQIESNEQVYVLTTAKCNYYNSKLVTSDAPPFNKVFIQWVKRLERTSKKDIYMKFFDTYGTHVPVEMLFGARYTFENSMTKKEFESKESKGMNIAMSASYSGKFSVGASFSLDSSQEEMARKFRQNVTTKTVTVGAAPPADGDAMKWASSVQSNPVPVYYRLMSIEDLFSAEFMKDLGVDFNTIFSNLVKFRKEYRNYLEKREFLSDCFGTDGRYVVLPKTAMRDSGPYREEGSLSDCLSICENDPTCVGFTMSDSTCDFADGEGPYKDIYGYNLEKSTTYLLWRDKTKKKMRLKETDIQGITFLRDSRISTVEKCEELCIKFDRCFAMTFRDSCRLFEKKKVFSYKQDAKSSAAIFSKCPELV